MSFILSYRQKENKLAWTSYKAIGFLLAKFGGTHDGYFLPSEGANITLALSSFSSLTEYDKYCLGYFKDMESLIAFDYAKQADCIPSYERNLFRPIV